MAEPSATNGHGDGSPATQLANRTGQSADPAPLVATSRRKRSRTASTKPLTVSLVIPVKNEARNIAWVLEQIADDVSEVILVDGNSTDATLITARSCRPDIRVVPQEGIGKGSALRAGFLAATGDIIVMMDADGSMSPQEIRHYLHFLNNGYDFVKGSRFIAGGGSLDITAFRRLGNRFLLAVFNSLYDGDLTDLCYGFCAFHRRYLETWRFPQPGSRSRPRWSCVQCRLGCGSQRFQVWSCLGARASRTFARFGMAPECCALWCATIAPDSADVWCSRFANTLTPVSACERRGMLKGDGHAPVGPVALIVGPGDRFLSGVSYITALLTSAMDERGPFAVLLLRRLCPRAFYPGRARVGSTDGALSLPEVPIFNGLDSSLTGGIA